MANGARLYSYFNQIILIRKNLIKKVGKSIIDIEVELQLVSIAKFSIFGRPIRILI